MKLSTFARAFGVVGSLLPSAYGWGGLGHTTVAFVASNFVEQGTEGFFQTVLNDSSPEYLANVATWADSYRYTNSGRFSEPFHFIDSKDKPPRSCSVSYSRDCGSTGCVVEAIQNYTTRLMDTDLCASERDIAAKFIVHSRVGKPLGLIGAKQFIGDIHQPLHDENLDRGGNGIRVTFGGVLTNLHAVWDTNIPEKLVGGYSLADAQRWASTLSDAIVSGPYSSQAASWLDGIDLQDPVSSSMIWATEANKYVCSTVMPKGAAALNGTELSGDYYTTAVPVVQLQIARAGYRLAAWLDIIASSLSETAEL